MKPTRLLLIRHAQSTLNAANAAECNIIGGQSLDIEITPKGVLQAEALGLYLKSQNVIPDTVYSSSATRTLRTMEITTSTMNLNLQATISLKILEQDAGTWQGMSKEIYNQPDIRLALDTDNWNFMMAKGSGESQAEVAERMLKFIREVFTAAKPGSLIAVFTHGLAIAFLIAVLELMTPEERLTSDIKYDPVLMNAYKKNIKNTAVTTLELSNGKVEIIEVNSVKHLTKKLK